MDKQFVKSNFGKILNESFQIKSRVFTALKIARETEFMDKQLEELDIDVLDRLENYIIIHGTNFETKHYNYLLDCFEQDDDSINAPESKIRIIESLRRNFDSKKEKPNDNYNDFIKKLLNKFNSEFDNNQMFYLATSTGNKETVLNFLSGFDGVSEIGDVSNISAQEYVNIIHKLINKKAELRLNESSGFIQLLSTLEGPEYDEKSDDERFNLREKVVFDFLQSRGVELKDGEIFDMVVESKNPYLVIAGFSSMQAFENMDDVETSTREGYFKLLKKLIKVQKLWMAVINTEEIKK